MNIFCVEVC